MRSAHRTACLIYALVFTPNPKTLHHEGGKPKRSTSTAWVWHTRRPTRVETPIKHSEKALSSLPSNDCRCRAVCTPPATTHANTHTHARTHTHRHTRTPTHTHTHAHTHTHTRRHRHRHTTHKHNERASERASERARERETHVSFECRTAAACVLADHRTATAQPPPSSTAFAFASSHHPLLLRVNLSSRSHSLISTFQVAFVIAILCGPRPSSECDQHT